MNFKRIISTALTVVMICSSLLAVIPVTASAASSAAVSTGDKTLSLEQIKTFVEKGYLAYDYKTAEEMLEAEKALGYLDYAASANGNYEIWINRYTGFVYYVNRITGQILTSNPIDPLSGASTDVERMKLMSQIEMTFSDAANAGKVYNYNSVQWAALYSQISVTEISGGLRVNYTLGDTSTRFLVPGRITAENFFNYILEPMVTRYEELFYEAMESVDEPDKAFTFFNNSKKYAAFVRYKDKEYDEFVVNSDNLKRYLSDTSAVYNNAKYGVDGNMKTALNYLNGVITQIDGKFSLNNLREYLLEDGSVDPKSQSRYDTILENYPITATTAIYVFDERTFNTNSASTLRMYSNYIKKYCPDYTMNMMYEHEAECGFEYVASQNPVVRCALEYTFNEDGSLSVALPANSITFDQSAYNLDNITPLRYFGYGDMSNDGYIFFPDGSGSVLEFSDFYTDSKKVAAAVSAKVYGQDYCYSVVTGQHREQVTMPVYGLVCEGEANAKTKTLYGTDRVTTGYFAIIEEGDSLATLTLASGGESHKYASVYMSCNPFPADKFSGTGQDKPYTLVSPNKYTGSYVTRIVMLTDSTVGNKEFGAGNFYDSTYSGMAAYYRNYLKADGTLTALELANENVPLYIEALGAMTITSKFLTFPVEKSIPLTTFDDIKTMYSELNKAEENVKKVIDEYTALAEAEENELLKTEYLHKVSKYKSLIGNIEDIKNINFRLTGFANGGMYSTYPAKVKWERVCGGKDGFAEILDESDRVSKAGSNLGIFPDFDFIYISNTSAFDGVSKKDSASKMIDNRYASKQVYNSVAQEFETFFTLLVSSDTLLEHFESFNEKFSKNSPKQLSAATLGSDINSNFDVDNTVNREDSKNNSIALLKKMVTDNEYEVMVDKGNAYAIKYATHILNASTDYSNFRYSSYSIPFVGMILHGYVNYTGAPLNYSGNPDYEILKTIESGAAPYYILCYQNAAYMKDDEQLNKYYGVDYATWYDEILLTYHELNVALKDVQLYQLVDHKTLIVERTAEEKEKAANYALLEAEILEMLDSQIAKAADDAIDSIANNPENYGKKIKVTVDEKAIYKQVSKILADYSELFTSGADSLNSKITEIAEKYELEYAGADENSVQVSFDAIEYESKYKFSTDSLATSGKDYEKTNYTVDNGNVVMVTYTNGDKTTVFVLNYNLYSVNVKIDGSDAIPLDSLGYVRIDK